MALKPRKQANAAKAPAPKRATIAPPASANPPPPAKQVPRAAESESESLNRPGEANSLRSPDARARPAAAPSGDWEAAYLENLARTCMKERSALDAGTSLDTVQRRRKADPAFAEREKGAMEVFGDMIESEITRRAIHGIVSTTIGKDGKTITTKTEYSDTLLLRLAERLETGSWRQKQQIEQTVSKAWFPTRADRKAALEKARAEAAVARAAALGGGELPRV